MSHRTARLGTAAFVYLSLATVGCSDPPTSVRPDEYVVAPTIEPKTISMISGETAQFRTSLGSGRQRSLGDGIQIGVPGGFGHGVPIGVLWASTDPSVAQVSSTGLVTARRAGSATITASVSSMIATASVTVTKPSLLRG